MSETKRVTLTTISNTALTLNSNNSGSGSVSASGRFGADFLSQTNKTPANTTKNNGGSIRLNIELFQTDSNKYPEFNYSKLIHLEKKRLKKSKQKSNSLADVFDNDNDGNAMKRIANELERKYGSSYGSGRSKNKRGDYDIGMGYDESDSFIDNSEAYDEIIPDEVETIEGGFYINCGALEFKKLHTESFTTKTDEIIKMPNRPNKRVLSSSSEDSSSSDDEDDDEDDESDDEDGDESIEESVKDMPKYKVDTNLARQKQKSISDGDASKSQSIKNKTCHNAEDNGMKKSLHKSIRKKQTAGVIQSRSSTSSPKQSDGNSGGGVSNVNNGGSGVGAGDGGNEAGCNNITGLTLRVNRADSERERVEDKIEKTTTVKDMLKAQRDQFLKSQHSNEVKPYINGDNNNKVKSSEDDVCDNNDDNSDTDDDDDDDDESLSNDSVDKVTEENSDSNHSSLHHNQQQRQEHQHKKQKNHQAANKKGAVTLNEKLRTTDTKLPEMDGDLLSNIIEFRDSLITKNLVGKRFQFNEKSIEDFLKIDDCLISDKTLRNLVYAHLEYRLALPKYNLLRKVRQLRVKEEKMRTKRAFHKLHKAVTEVMPTVIASYEAELRKYAELQAAHINSDQPLKMPKKKFPWNHNLRNLLYDVYQMRWKSYPVLATRKDTLSTFLTDYMTQKVVKIWPNGWMSYDELQSEIEKRKITNKKNERKKLQQEQQQMSLAATTIAPTTIGTAGTVTSTITQPSMNLTVGIMQASSTGPNAFMKQFEEFATTRSNANCDTDSVANSSTSSSLKRKYQEVNSDTVASISQNGNNRQGEKKKYAKSHNDHISSGTLNMKDSGQQQSHLSQKDTVEEPLPTFNSNKRIDNNINHIMISVAPATLISTALTTSNAITTSTGHVTTAITNSKTVVSNNGINNNAIMGHSFTDSHENAHIIDLDNYENLYDILNATKAMQPSTASTVTSSSSSTLPSSSAKALTTNSRRESSGDSEIEIVSVYKAKFPVKQRTNKTNNRNNSNNNNNNNNNFNSYQQNVDSINVFSIEKNKNSNSNKGKYSKANKQNKQSTSTNATTTTLTATTTTATITTGAITNVANSNIDNIKVEPTQTSSTSTYMKIQ